MFDAYGRTLRETAPYFSTDTAPATTYPSYDALNRPTSRTLPNGLTSYYSYNGLTNSITVNSLTMQRSYSTQDWLLETKDANGNFTRFAYDSAGRPLAIEDANGNTITASYNGFGHKTQVNDPNQGQTTFHYNTLGELTHQTDANGVTTTHTYDLLGRITQTSITGGNQPSTFTYRYDSCKTGMLCEENGNGITRTYTYDSLSRPTTTTATIDSKVYHTSVAYDANTGHQKSITYPNGLVVGSVYNDLGYLTKLVNANSGYVYQALNNIDANGQYTHYTLGNGQLVATASYRHDSGTMKEVKVTRDGTTLHHHRYLNEDAFMNLTDERNEMTGMEKRYSYDDLHRLTRYQVTQGSPNLNFTVNYAYDAVGNLLQKSDYANSYHYVNSSQCAQTTHPANGVCQVTKLDGSQVSFDYDARGNMTTGDSLTMTYNAMDKPLTVNGKGTQTRFTYGPNQMRHKQVRTTNGETTTTHYLDKLYEIDLETNHWRAYIGDAAQLAWTQDNGLQLLFTLKDRLGSATTLVNQDGQLISRRYFDPFGKSASELPSSLDTVSFGMTLSEFRFTDLTETNRYRRGFTGHEHLNEQQLIHMNGRIYDYNLGRFMSVDPVIQSPANTQSVNPYSYIMNNPLAGTDPTGYQSETVKENIYVGGGGSVHQIKRKIGSRSVTTTTNAAGEITNVATQNVYKSGLTTVSSVNYSNGSAKSADVVAVNTKTGHVGAASFDFKSQTEVSKTQYTSDFVSIGKVPGYSETGGNSWRKENDVDYILAVDMHNYEFGYSPSDNGFWTPQRLKAQAMIESGGVHDRSEYLRDPLQVNRTYYNPDGSEKKTDWVDAKAIKTELVSKKQTMVPFTSARNSLMWSRYKGWLHNSLGIKYKYKGDFGALRDYNGNNKMNKTLNGEPARHKNWYAESILKLEERMY